MNFHKKTLLGSLLLLSATSAFAVDTADLRVIGTIVPTACTPTFSGGGVVDYGIIPTASLSSTDVTQLETRTISYTIVCDAPISIGTSWSDGRQGTANNDSLTQGRSALHTFGLGQQGAANIGRYTLSTPTGAATGDGASVDSIERNGVGAWTLSSRGFITNSTYDRTFSFAPSGTLVPGAYTTFSGVVNVEAAISPTSTLDLTRSVVLDGLSTMTVRYL
ncbi:DUF1120 domain-containing protein [Pseudomonas chlororaphis]|uniref:DUF1120 domain-containing protein n=1 Tax=Pseudomonas chlororaphis TaxID=587753 RepID=UPI002D78D605|nr:DUF1120 domain-containing protein [Pseudomonas chlororaphis]